MADILSKEELDALLGQMKQDDDEDEAPEDDPFEAVGAEAIEEELPESIAAAEAVEAAEDEEEEALDWGDAAPSGREVNVEMILDIPIKVSVELGRARMTVGDLLQFGQGAVIELDHLANDLIDLTVNRKVVAQGEVVVINENFGFRVIEVDSVRDRIRKL
ncbi:MAG: flagellar motor switch protein FliN [Myxococcales bacterium]|nr:flagellar motor switch protein FliN [Myxococcales bacterium]